MASSLHRRARRTVVTAVAASAAAGTIASLTRFQETVGFPPTSSKPPRVVACEEASGIATAMLSLRSKLFDRGAFRKRQPEATSASMEEEGRAVGARGSAAMGRRERWTLRSAARCVHAEFKTPREMDSRVRQDCGEDAFFLGNITDGVMTVGVADGVGGWAGHGIDPALFAWELMNRCQDAAEESAPTRSSSSSGPLACEEARADPKRVLATGFERLQRAAGGPPVGSSTACVASLDCHNGVMHIANLGDSGAMIVKGSDGACVMESIAQQHRFNCPYQLMVAPGGYSGGDPPSVADVYSAKVEDGDILLLATDGLLDNVSTEQAAAIAAEMRKGDLGSIAERLVQLAVERSQSWEETPFSISAKKHGYRHFGGKPDDITVVVARVESTGA